jgi:hypothetical protein
MGMVGDELSEFTEIDVVHRTTASVVGESFQASKVKYSMINFM